MWHKFVLEVSTRGKGLYDITAEIQAQVKASGVQDGMCFVFVPHTSASLVLNENWDPTARADLEEAFEQRTGMVSAHFGRLRRHARAHPHRTDPAQCEHSH